VPELQDLPVYIAAVGALGVAAFGMVDAFGKTLFVGELKFIPGRPVIGLPFAGFKKVRRLAILFEPALKAAYGDDVHRLVRRQYRAGRSHGEAPETLRQGVRLGLPFLEVTEASRIIRTVWGLPSDQSDALARALTGEKRGEDVADAKDAQALAARWAASLDAHVQAAFDSADQIYQAYAQFLAGVLAMGLSLAYFAAAGDLRWGSPATWVRPLLIGVAAVPLAPIAKDVSSRLSEALGALRQLNPRG